MSLMIPLVEMSQAPGLGLPGYIDKGPPEVILHIKMAWPFPASCYCSPLGTA